MKIIKKKRCKICNDLFTPYNSLQQVCSPICAVKFVKQKTKKDKEMVDKWIKGKKEQDTLQSHLLHTRTLVHKMVRLRDHGKPCISCGCSWLDNFEAGHYHKAELYSSLRFDFFNIWGQCKKCNSYLEGNLDAYKLRLPYIIGFKQFDALNRRATLDKKFIKIWTRTELKEIQNKAKILIKKFNYYD